MRLLTSLLEEMTTGTGASFNPGQGEQIATPLAFGSKKRPRRMTLRKNLEEVISYTPEKRDELFQKYLKALKEYQGKVERYINSFEAYSIGDMLDNTEKAEQFASIGEKLYEELSKIDSLLSDLVDESEDEDPELSKKISALENTYWRLIRPLDAVYDAMQDITGIISKLKEDEKYKRQTP